ncbi:MAG: Planctomycete cytochrome, partial [Armatimonadetes bacterium]|nr:Planctomycete cytochrome [Armatimonadota bacterium]
MAPIQKSSKFPDDLGRVPVGVLLSFSLLGIPLLQAAAQPGKVAAPVAVVDYNRDIRPILAANCFSCHGQDASARQANLRLDLREAAIALHGGKRAVEPGNPAASTLVARLNATDGRIMPPAASGHRLNAEQKRLLTAWVKQGAPYAVHWSFAPLKRPLVPAIRAPKGAVRNPIDAFVQARLAREGLAPSPQADAATLLRRVSLDLTGLPPTAQELETYLRDLQTERPTKSPTPGAYERAVDRLLASPRYGEHWARMWLDLARYADTQGYEKDGPRTIWRYRDWVIDAFNADLPYDQFTIQQLAGDLWAAEELKRRAGVEGNGETGMRGNVGGAGASISPSPRFPISSLAELPADLRGAILATAFHRNTMTNTEGGTDPEEFRVAAVKDRVDTTAQVWMGLTMGCAKCHTHKYDPITQKEYYSFYALFNQTEDANRGNETPTVAAPTDEQFLQITALDEKLKGLREAFSRPHPELEGPQRAWEAELAAKSLWTPLRFESATATSGAKLQHRADGAVLVSGARAEKDLYTLTLTLPRAAVTALRLEVLKDSSLPNGGPGREATDQNVVTSELTVERIAAGGERSPVRLKNPRADFEQGGWPIAGAVDGSLDKGWAFSPQNAQPHVAVFDLDTPLTADGGSLVVTIRQDYPKLHHGCFRVSVSGAEPKLLTADLQPFAEVAALPRDRRTPEQQRRLDEAFRQTMEPTAAIYREIAAVEKERDTLSKAIAATPILRDLATDKQRVTRIHQRGNFLDPGETVTPSVPSAFRPLPAGAPLNRLGAAQWLVSKDNPLTARVAVNRVWSRLFGAGLVETEEDFGTQGSAPTHPELLDWLAYGFANGNGASGGGNEEMGKRGNGGFA